MKRRRMSSEATTAGPSKLLVKLKDAMETNKFYEAHQLLKTIYFRYSNSGKIEELENLLRIYSVALFQNNQIESGCDVSIMLAKLLKEKRMPVTDERMKLVVQLFNSMPSNPERMNFLITVLEWCGQCNASGALHEAAAKKYTEEKCYGEAWKHLTRVSDGTSVKPLAVPILTELQLRSDEIDIAISILVLSYLVIKRVQLAEQAYSQLVQGQELTPLLNGVRFLIESAKRNSPSSFAAIRDLYEPSFFRDNYLRKLVAMAGKNFFGLQDRLERGNESFLPAFMNALFGGEQ